MRRASTHLAFGVIALCCAAVAAYDGLKLKHAHAVAQAVAVTLADTGNIVRTRGGSGDASDPPEVQLARAMVLSKAGAYADAQKLYDGLIQDEGNSDLTHTALFDLGNMYVHQATGGSSSGPVRSLPLLEQAKQRYRQLLRVSPGDWDARYNLERALWFAPEASEGADEPDVKEQHDVKLRGAEAEDLP
jgi:mxaK protein